jgi:hypothetical protein
VVSYSSITSVAAPSLDQSVSHRAVVNGALGFEYYLKPTIPIRAGLYTDFSAAHNPSPSGYGEDQVNLYGATLSVGHVSEHTSSTLGLIAAFGTARILAYDLEAVSYSTFVSTGTQWRLYAVWSSSYAF